MSNSVHHVSVDRYLVTKGKALEMRLENTRKCNSNLKTINMKVNFHRTLNSFIFAISQWIIRTCLELG